MNKNSQKTNARNFNYLFQIFYGPIQVNNQQLTQVQTKNIPLISFKAKLDKYYTILMYDLHSVKPTFLHYGAVNVKHKEPSSPFISYYPPSPPKTDKHYHVYMFVLYEQPGFLTIDPPSRIGFNPDKFADQYGLQKIAQQGFYINPRV
jgi:phosphatidylethanolamine-binding protein (PEBP) family uncharacterized protein